MQSHSFNVVISEARNVDGYCQVVFVNGSTLSIYNPCVFEGIGFSELKGCTLKEIREDESANMIVLTLDSGSFCVNVHPDVWTGPEAMVLSGPGNSIMVWN